MLQLYVNVDIYGICGPLKCPKQNSKGNGLNFCERKLKNTYKFYLSFENSLCVEYFTEKVEKVYNLDVVPIVLGHARYNQHLPPKSFIDVRDFRSPKHLADYLKILDANDTLYNEYFAWKERYEIVRIKPECQLCEFAHKQKGRRSSIHRLDLFWSRELDCVQPKEFYRHITR
jgi:hypothetical protein